MVRKVVKHTTTKVVGMSSEGRRTHHGKGFQPADAARRDRAAGRTPDRVAVGLPLPALHLPAVSVPPITLSPGLLPAITSPGLVRPGLLLDPVPDSPTTPVASPAVVTAVTPSFADPAPVAVSTANAGAPAAAVLRSTVVEMVQQLSPSVTPTALGTSAAVVLAAAIGLAVSGSLGAAASGWAGMALAPAARSTLAVGASRRFGPGPRHTAWRAPYRPAFSPD